MRISIDYVEQGDGTWRVAQTHTDDDGTTRRHLVVFPLDALEWRAAEYGIDPADTHTLMDIVLAEGHMTPDDWAQGHHLHTAPDIDTARKDHLARVAKVKLRHRILTRGATHPLQRVRDESPMHPEAVALKAQHVHRERHTIAQQAAQTPQQHEHARIAQLRRDLGHGNGVA